MKTALLAGATGLIGKQLLALLEKDAYYEKVFVLTRKPLAVSGKCENLVVNFDVLNEALNTVKADDVFCCLGTTMKVAGSKDAFRKVDYTYPLLIAQYSKQQGASQYLLVSALGANENSSIFYNKVKGEIEKAIEKLNFLSFQIFRPSLLLGNRNEQRSGEDAAKIFYRFFGFLFPAKYKAIESLTVAQVMLLVAKQKKEGLHIYESHMIEKL